MGKRILVVDEDCFSRVCAAILGDEGYDIKAVSSTEELSFSLKDGDINLLITSYPFGSFLFGYLRWRRIPSIILTDQLNHDFINTLEGLDDIHCMVKPLDYSRFRTLVKQVLSGESQIQGGYKIV